MIDNYQDDLNIKRETNKVGLETFALDRHNVLDRPIDKIIKELKKIVAQEYSEYYKLSDLQTNDPKRFEELEERAQLTSHSLYFQMNDYIRTALTIEEELTTLFEMKIIYAFKHIEIEIKNLISAAFGSTSIRKSSKWENLIEFLKSKSIEINKIENYREVNQLRIVNNSLKHSNDQIDNNLKVIDEFKEIKYISYKVLESFYNRVKESPNSFLESLSSSIYENLYVFNEDKIESLSKSIVLKMDKENAKKLIKSIKNKYN